MTGVLYSIVAEHDTQGARRLGRANAPDRGLLVASVAPDLAQRFELGWALLEALGKRQDVSGHGRHDELNWEVLHAWLLAQPIRAVVLLDAQWLRPSLVPDVAGLVATCGIDLWLVAHRPVGEAYEDALNAWPHRPARAADLVRLVRPGTSAPTTPPPAPFPEVPSDNWPTFRHACAQSLSAEDFIVVDTLFRASLRAAEAVFAEAEPSEGRVLAHLRGALDEVATVAEMTTIVRATQVAAHRAGWLLQADPARLRAASETMSRAALGSPDTWRRLRAYRLPYRGSAVALSAIGLNVGDMLAIPCDAIADDGDLVTTPDGVARVPAGAEVFLRAQLLYRRLMGAPGDAPLFATDDGPLRDRALADALRQPARELGVPVLDVTTSRAPDPTSGRWRDRWGLSLQRLSR